LNTSPYHAACNGLQERGNKVIAAMLSHYVITSCNDWDKYLQAILFAVRSSVCDSSIGHSPFYLLYGREPVLPLEACTTPETATKEITQEFFPLLIERLEVAQQVSRQIEFQNKVHMKKVYDDKCNPIHFSLGNCVYLFTPNMTQKSHCKKLARKWVGPFVIFEMVNQLNVKLRNLENNKVVPTLNSCQ